MILLQSHFEGSRFVVKPLPGQSYEEDKISVKPEDLQITAPILYMGNFPINTVFVAHDYDFPSTDHLNLRESDLVPLFHKETPFPPTKLSSANPTLFQSVCDYVVDYLLTNEEFTPEKVKALADSWVSYGYKFDWDAKVNPPVSAGGTGAGTMRRTIAATYPCPKEEDIDFYIDPDVWFLLVRNVLRKENSLLMGPTGLTY